MIIEARGDIVTLRGTLSENHWDAIAAAVDLVLPEHPQGILMDCSALSAVSDMGGATFMDGLSYMEARGARIILCRVPPDILSRLRSIPGLHSQVPIAESVEQGRQSLDTAGASPLTARANTQVVLVPVNPPFSSHAVSHLIRRLNLGNGAELHFIYTMVVPRSLPVGAPLPEEESRAEQTLAEAERFMPGLSIQRHVTRARNIPEAICEAVSKLNAAEVVVGLDPESAEDEEVGQIVGAIRRKCQCALTFTQEHSTSPTLVATSPVGRT